MKNTFFHGPHSIRVSATATGNQSHARIGGKTKTLCNRKAVSNEMHRDEAILADVVTCQRCRNALNL